MARRKGKRPSNWQSLKSWLKDPKNRPAITVTIVLVLIAGLWGYHAVAKWQNKRQFEHARASIDQLYSDIVANVGKPDNHKRTDICSRPNMKFEQGPLSCDVDLSFIYGVENEPEALDKMHKIQNVINSHKDFNSQGAVSKLISSSSIGSNLYQGARDTYKYEDLDCVVVFTYDTPSETYLELTNSLSKKTFYISIGCGGYARSEVFPLAPA
jgi:hypothetical protein